MKRTLGTDARAILSTATVATHRSLLAWAAGVLECGHAVDPLIYWRTRDVRRLAPEYAGQTLDRSRMLRVTPARIEITDGNLPQPLRVTWTDVAAVLDCGRVTNALIRDCEAAVTAWREHPGCQAPGWQDVVNACISAGDAVWAACRPADPGEQLDLFSAAGA